MNFSKSDLNVPEFLRKHLGSMGTSKEPTCLYDIWASIVDKYANYTIFRDEYCKYSYTMREFFDKTTQFAAGFQKLGVKKNSKVAFFSENSSKWVIVDQAVLACGAVNAVRGSSAPKSELEYIWEHSDSMALVTDSSKVIKDLSSIFMTHKPKFILYIGNENIAGFSGLSKIPFYTFEQFDEFSKNRKFWRTTINKNDPATIMYSSGTTGNPKGVLLSHGNIMYEMSAVHPVIKIKPGRSTLNVLPIWHAYQRTCQYYAMSRGCLQNITNVRNFKKDLTKYCPNYIYTVPRIWVMIYDGIHQQVRSLPLYAQLMFKFFLNISKTTKKAKRIIKNRSIYHNSSDFTQKIMPFFLANILTPVDKFSMKFVYKKIKNALGGKFIKGISGGGAIPAYVEDFFEAIGVNLFVGYGLTETAPVLTVRKEEDNKMYSVGPALQNTEIKIVDPTTYEKLKNGKKGLILARGPQVMLGYYKDEEATKKAITPDGWFVTGDLGWFTQDNCLVISGRLKEIIVLSNGENIGSESLEEACEEIAYIKQIVVTGQDMPSLTALVVLNNEEVARVFGAKSKAVTDPNNLKDFKAMLLNEINQKIKNRPTFRQFERISNIYFLKEPFTIENGMLTQTLKIKKNVVFEKYSAEIKKMYKK